MATRGWGQVDLVRELGIGKGNVSKFLDERHPQGLSPPAALRLIELAGYQLEPLLRRGEKLVAFPSVRELPNYLEVRGQLTDHTAEVLDAATRAIDGIGAMVLDLPMLEAAAALVHVTNAAARRAKPQREVVLGATAKKLAAEQAAFKGARKAKDGAG